MRPFFAEGGGWHKKWSKTAFFAKSPSPRKFFGEKFFMGSTMRKSTDSAFRICGSHRGTYDQKFSYCSSKSGQVGKSGFVTENTGCHKKIRRAQFFFKSLFLLRGFSKYHLKTSLRRNKLFLKKWICLIFLWHALCLIFFSGFCPYFGGWQLWFKSSNLQKLPHFRKAQDVSFHMVPP